MPITVLRSGRITTNWPDMLVVLSTDVSGTFGQWCRQVWQVTPSVLPLWLTEFTVDMSWLCEAHGGWPAALMPPTCTPPHTHTHTHTHTHRIDSHHWHPSLCVHMLCYCQVQMFPLFFTSAPTTASLSSLAFHLNSIILTAFSPTAQWSTRRDPRLSCTCVTNLHTLKFINPRGNLLCLSSSSSLFALSLLISNLWQSFLQLIITMATV